MTILKLLAYSLFGYVLYELYLGISEGVEAKTHAPEEPSAPTKAPATPKRSAGGKFVSVAGVGGARTKRSVGRGVI